MKALGGQHSKYAQRAGAMPEAVLWGCRMEQKVKERCCVRGVVCVCQFPAVMDDGESSAKERAGQSLEDDMDSGQGLVPTECFSAHLTLC